MSTSFSTYHCRKVSIICLHALGILGTGYSLAYCSLTCCVTWISHGIWTKSKRDLSFHGLISQLWLLKETIFSNFVFTETSASYGVFSHIPESAQYWNISLWCTTIAFHPLLSFCSSFSSSMNTMLHCAQSPSVLKESNVLSIPYVCNTGIFYTRVSRKKGLPILWGLGEKWFITNCCMFKL